MAPERLDTWLATHRGISRSGARTLIDAGMVAVRGKVGRPGTSVHESREVVVTEPPAAAVPDIEGPAVYLNVLYEDEWLAVIDKPAGMVVHPAPGHPTGTLADGLRQRGSTWSFAGGMERPGIVHRLDRDVSGLLVVAKKEEAHRHLAQQLASRTMGRTYWALVWGVLGEQTATVDAPIGRDPRDRKRMAVVDTGRAAVTDLAVIERLDAATILDVTLRSGRTHQIRVHLSYIGHPIVDDPVYGRRHERGHGGRPALHARELRFEHPADGKHCVFASPLPPDLRQLAASVRELPA